ncbi:NAD(P)-binding protein [Cryphonectria parasitica EP155]|uniref:D-xylose 1-dehydrogenase (NADP(+), D-xylono-1,5-lactone-forming) n=1 Tax=Cryphonectria parasitica (strain ATCC 38755 / EP155) TaxID=660469 RepID=A0A9P5CNC6_CRYP1|nr:NAD(P)-binding protein [Cryphonectria parasitica EP155]KAF3764177.1 NAD(P)-binding protein [Cryphonectria parasitica EP155]
MGASVSCIRRNQLLVSPPVVAKNDGALKIGILGAANIAPIALVNPAKSNPNVIVSAVAARDKTKAIAFAKKHSIENVKDSYDAVLDDPSIDAVYIPLPNGLHYEWALKALNKGKHVLLEKPSTSNAQEAEALFHAPVLSRPNNAPVLLEAFHSRFTPALALFKSVLDQPNIEHAVARVSIPSLLFNEDDIRFQYDLAGGALMDLGTYTVAFLRETFGVEPTECLAADLTRMPPPHEKCDGSFKATLRFPNGGTGEIDGTLRGSNIFFTQGWPSITVTHRPVVVTDHGEQVGEGCEVKKTRSVYFANFMLPPHYHRVDIVDEFVVVKGDSQVVKKFTKKETKKAYTWKEMGRDLPSEPWYSTYGYMLEQFVNKIRGQEGTGIFISHEDSIAQMKALDMIYEKSGLGQRRASIHRL